MVFAVVGVVSALSLTSCQQQQQNGTNGDSLRGLVVGDCLGNVYFSGEVAMLDNARIVDCSSTDAELKVYSVTYGDPQACSDMAMYSMTAQSVPNSYYCLEDLS